MSTYLTKTVNSFRKEDEGTVTILFSLMAIALFLFAGVAIDYSRLTDVRSKLTAAADAATLAAGRAMLDGQSSAAVIEVAKTYFKANTETIADAKVDEPNVEVDPSNGSVKIDATTKVGMTLMRIGGFNDVTVPTTATATFQQRDIEVGMALDVTGSMLENPLTRRRNDGPTKLEGLKSAFATFADKLFPANKVGDHKVRVALAPYSAGIKLGSYVSSATDPSKPSKDGCVTERKTGAAGDATGTFYVASESKNDVDPTEGKYDFVCPPPAILPLSDSKTTLLNAVNAYEANGGTSGHLGVQWAWNLISDKWGGVWGGNSTPESYEQVKKGKLLKAVVLMTDGVFNTAFHGGKSATQAVALCEAMKKEGVVVFAVGFGLGGNATALNTLKSCATPGPDYFADAASSEELDAAFAKFAGKLSELRISN